MNDEDRKLLASIASLVAATAHIVVSDSKVSHAHKKKLTDNVGDVLQMVEKYADDLTK